MRLEAGGLAQWASPEQNLLVLTDEHRLGRHGLSLAFRDATVAAIEGPHLAGVEGIFDTVVIERDDLTLDQLTQFGCAARMRLRPHGYLLVALGAERPAAGTNGGGDPAGPVTGAGGAPAQWWDALRWCGVTVLDGLPFAVMEATDCADNPPAGTTTASLVAAAQAVRQLTAAGLSQAEGATHLPAWYRSEQALLDQLDLAVAAADQERGRVADQRRIERALRDELARLRRHLADQRHRERSLQEQLAQAHRQLNLMGAVKAQLRRHRAGRAVLRVGRYGRALLRRARPQRTKV